MSITSLYEAAKKGNKNAENELFRTLSVRLHVFAYRKLGDDELARELVQGTILKVIERYKDVEFEVGLSAWSYGILMNEIMNYWQRKSRHKKLLEKKFRDDTPVSWNGDPLYESKMLDCLKKLVQYNNLYARVLNLKYQGYETEEILKRLRISSNNLYVILHRARLAMKTCLETEGDD